MILCLDVGNTQIHGGVFDNDKLVVQFRKTSKDQCSSDEYGLFLRTVLRENNVNLENINQISLCSVVPDKVYSLRSACLKYFKMSPFVLQAGVKTGLKIKYKNPVEVGADRIANAVAATHMFPNENVIVIDYGTATTMCVVTKDKEYLGGAIFPGVRMSMEALEGKTAKLPTVEIVKAKNAIGQSTIESIQSGLYYGQIGMTKEIINRAKEEAFNGQNCKLIATGGFSSMFDEMNIFDQTISDLALRGLYLSLKLNH